MIYGFKNTFFLNLVKYHENINVKLIINKIKNIAFKKRYNLVFCVYCRVLFFLHTNQFNTINCLANFEKLLYFSNNEIFGKFTFMKID